MKYLSTQVYYMKQMLKLVKELDYSDDTEKSSPRTVEL